MFPQRELRDCSYAVEEMLLAEGKRPQDVHKQIINYRPNGNRRELDAVKSSLEKRSGMKTMETEGDRSMASLEKLQKNIKQYGPCIFRTAKGHLKILDEIEIMDGHALLTLRDPFSASVLQIRDHRELWLDPTEKKQSEAHRWTAVFLKRR